MKFIVLIFCSLILFGCAISGTQMQAECELKFTDFIGIYDCTRENIVARNPSILQDDRAKLYMLRGEELVSYVKNGTMTDIQAKVLWQKLYVELRADKLGEVREQLDSIAKSLPKPNTTHCTSYMIGGIVTTNCL